MILAFRVEPGLHFLRVFELRVPEEVSFHLGMILFVVVFAVKFLVFSC